MEFIQLTIEKKGRSGKTVTILDGFTRCSEELEVIARGIKIACGTGGTVQNNRIEIQGDLRRSLSIFLKKQGFQIKGF